MALRMGLLGKKIGMTQVFGPDGERVPVTAIATGPPREGSARKPERDVVRVLERDPQLDERRVLRDRDGRGDRPLARPSRPNLRSRNNLSPPNRAPEPRPPTSARRAKLSSTG